MTTYSIDAHTCSIELLLTKGSGWPAFDINHPCSISHEDEQEYSKTIMVYIPELTSNQIVISRHNKTDTDTIFENEKIVRDQKLSINRIWINDVLVDLNAIKYEFKFYPEYSDSNLAYAKENHIDLPVYQHETNMFYNGQWIFEFEQPFFTWYNQLLLKNLNQFNYWIKQTHLGEASEQKIKQLSQILAQMS